MSEYSKILKEANGSIEKLIEMGPDLSDMNNNEKSEVLRMKNVSNYANELISLGFTLSHKVINRLQFAVLSIDFIEAFNLDPVRNMNLLKPGERLKLLQQSLSGERSIDNEQLRTIVLHSLFREHFTVDLLIALDEMTGFMNYKKGKHNFPMELLSEMGSKELIDYIYDNYLDMLDIKSLFMDALSDFDEEGINYYLEKVPDIVDRCVDKAVMCHIYMKHIKLLYPHASDPQKFADWVIKLCISNDNQEYQSDFMNRAKVFKFLLDHYTMDEIIEKIKFFSKESYEESNED